MKNADAYIELKQEAEKLEKKLAELKAKLGEGVHRGDKGIVTIKLQKTDRIDYKGIVNSLKLSPQKIRAWTKSQEFLRATFKAI
tara:strand:+ start:231 stop:482 length:252 start_codon:yes stop_codon:yes gene_type:complete